MKLTRERGIYLLNSFDINELSAFIREYCQYHKKDYNMTTILIQSLIGNNTLKLLVDSTVKDLMQKQNLSIITLMDLRNNKIIKFF